MGIQDQFGRSVKKIQGPNRITDQPRDINLAN